MHVASPTSWKSDEKAGQHSFGGRVWGSSRCDKQRLASLSDPILFIGSMSHGLRLRSKRLDSTWVALIYDSTLKRSKRFYHALPMGLTHWQESRWTVSRYGSAKGFWGLITPRIPYRCVHSTLSQHAISVRNPQEHNFQPVLGGHDKGPGD
jgi:hypothetical protein